MYQNASLRALALGALAVACHAAIAAEIDATLSAAAARDGRVDALIVLPDQTRPLLAPLAPGADYKERRRALVEALRARATTQQSTLRDWLDAHAVEYRSYWIANLIWARLSAADLRVLAQRSDVARIAANPSIPLERPAQPAASSAPDAIAAIEPGVARIEAPLVWANGFTGQGVVIGGEDTGYQWDHPALKNQYRGWDGMVADHDYNWHDAIHDSTGNPCGNDAPAPCDDVDHGTHTAGTFAGDDGGSNQIGVAPGARWIGCRNMDQGNGTPARYIECIQWMLAPTDLNDANPDPDLGADVVSNSWTCPVSEGCTTGQEIAAAVDNAVAGGIFFVAAAANDGPACGTIGDPPAIYDASFVVGASNGSDDSLAGFSSRGPVTGTTLIRPDVVAPGVLVRSSIPVNTYAMFNGTSMATPHVAGAAALLMSVNPALKGHPDQVAQLLRDTAVRTLTDPDNPGCGGLTIADWPNYQAGYGRIDVYAAALQVFAADTIFEDGFDGAPGG